MAEGPVAVVTGGSSGIGRATAEHLVDLGYRVLICARGADRLEETARDLGPDRVAWHACDVGDEGAADEAIGAAIDRFGRLDGLVCAAGVIGSFKPIVELTPAEWTEVLGINLMGPIHFTKAATPALRDTRGAVVIVSSVNALQAEPVMAPYGVAKAGLVNFTMYAALELAPAGIRVNCVAPGWVMTEMSRAALDGATGETIRHAIPLGRPGTPGEIAGPIAFLASDLASYLHGQILSVNGGAVMIG